MGVGPKLANETWFGDFGYGNGERTVLPNLTWFRRDCLMGARLQREGMENPGMVHKS